MHHKTATLLAVALGVAVSIHAPAGQVAAPPMPFPLTMDEREVVDQFDRDGNGRLDAAERRAAREWLATQPATGLPGMGRRGRGGPPDGRFGGGRAGGPFGGRGLAPASQGARLAPADVTERSQAGLYDPTTLRTLFLQFEDDDWEEELEAFYNTDIEVPAALTVDGRTYQDVGVGFRGLSSYMAVPAGSKRSFNVSIDAADDDQRVFGYRTLNLLNGLGDPTLVRTVLYSEIARQYIPTPKANYVRVAINEENWGIYINLQQFNSDFVREWFPAGGGARWKVPGSPMGGGGMVYLGEDPAAYKAAYDIRSRDDERSWRALIALFRTLNETPAERLEEALRPMLDVDGALKFLALEVALVNSDGYWARASDYNLYLDAGGRFHVIPHDFNEAFGAEGPGGGFGGPGGRRGLPPGFTPGGAPPPDFPFPGFPGGRPPLAEGGPTLDPLVGLDDATKPLRSKLLAVPALRERYLRYVRDIAERWLDWNRLEPMIRAYQATIAAEVMADTRKLYSTEAFRSGVSEGENSLKAFVERRRAYLLRGR